MSCFIEASERRQRLLPPDCIDDRGAGDGAVRVVDMFVDALDLGELGFDGGAASSAPSPSLEPEADDSDAGLSRHTRASLTHPRKPSSHSLHQERT